MIVVQSVNLQVNLEMVSLQRSASKMLLELSQRSQCELRRSLETVTDVCVNVLSENVAQLVPTPFT